MTIASALTSLRQSVLNEIGAFQSNSSTPAGTQSTTAPASDQVGISGQGSLFQALEQIQASNPAEFKQVTADAAAKLRDAAKQDSDPQQAQFLNNLANEFQKASDTGSMDPIKSGFQHQATHHRHHHFHAEENASSTDVLTNLLKPSQTSSSSGS